MLHHCLASPDLEEKIQESVCDRLAQLPTAPNTGTQGTLATSYLFLPEMVPGLVLRLSLTPPHTFETMLGKHGSEIFMFNLITHKYCQGCSEVMVGLQGLGHKPVKR